MSDSRQFILVMVVAALFVGWLGWRGMTVINLNNGIQEHSELADYPYPFRVLRVEGNTAVMSTIRSPHIATTEALRELFPSLRGVNQNSREFQRVEREFARLQARASEVVLASPSVDRIRWELDANWYYLNDMKLRQRGPGTLSVTEAG